MTSDALRARESWRRAEADYVDAITAFLEPPGDARCWTRSSLIALIRLRSTADARREAYFLAGEQAPGATGRQHQDLAAEWSDIVTVQEQHERPPYSQDALDGRGRARLRCGHADSRLRRRRPA